MNLPNKITIFRILLIPIFMIFAFPMPEFLGALSIPYSVRVIVSLVILIVGDLSDMADGKIARKYNLITDFGKFLDPVADKILVTAALLAICAQRPVYVWATMVILLREFTVTGFRLVASSKGVVIAAGKLGKIKTVFQTVGLTVLFGAPVLGLIYEPLNKIFTITGDVIMIIAVVFTIISGVEYIVKNANVLKGEM